MRSRASFFNKQFSLHLLRRFWPMWLLWLSFLLLAGPVNLATEYDENLARYVSYLRHSLLDSALAVVIFAGIAGALMAMAMLSWLYNARTCGLVASLPMRRETAFNTAVLTGLVPMLISEALVALVILVLYRGRGVENRYVLEWLGAAAFSTVGFYGFACFCGVLTGSVLVLPVVYGLLLVAVPLTEALVRSLFGELLYGYSYGEVWTLRLSPPIWLGENMKVKNLVESDYKAGIAGVYSLTELNYLAVFCAIGVAFVLLAVLILRKRHMETAGEIVAVPVLRPIFRVCMAVGFSLAGTLLFMEAFAYNLRGAARLTLLLVLLCVFAALGWFVAEMLIRKTLRVFDHGWKQIGVICACLLTLAILTELDVTGYETRVPKASEVESVELGMLNTALRETESVEAVIALHENIIAHKAENKMLRSGDGHSVSIGYVLKNGKTLQRLYNIAENGAAWADPNSDIALCQKVCNLPEARRSRVLADRDFGAADIAVAEITVDTPDLKMERWTSETIRLTPEQAVSLYREGILPDALTGGISRWYLWSSPEREAEQTNLTVDIRLIRDEEEPLQHRPLYLSARVLFDSENTLRWLRENLGLEPRTLAEIGTQTGLHPIQGG